MFAKIFASIFDSSIAEDWQTRVVFQDMLVLADKDGIVDMTPTSIARRTNMPLEMVQAAIPKLEGPDASSRTQDNEGRRIVRLDQHRDWGWQIVNFTKYRESATKEMLRMGDADRKRAWRARYGKPSSPTPPTPNSQMQKQRAEADMSRTCPGHVPDSTPSSSISRLEGWQLGKDLKRLKDDIKTERLKNTPDHELLKAWLEQIAAIKAEIKRRHRGTTYPKQSNGVNHAVEPTRIGDGGQPLKYIPPDEARELMRRAKEEAGIIPNPNDRNAGTYNEGRSGDAIARKVR